MSSHDDKLAFSFPVWISFSLFCLMPLIKISNTMLNKSDKSDKKWASLLVLANILIKF